MARIEKVKENIYKKEGNTRKCSFSTKYKGRNKGREGRRTKKGRGEKEGEGERREKEKEKAR